MTDKTVMVPVELLKTAIEYMEYTYNGVDHFKTILKAAPKVEGEPVGYLDLSRTKITDNPYFTVGPVTNHPGWFPVYAAPQQAKAKWLPMDSCPNDEDILIARDDGSVELIKAEDNDYDWQPYPGKDPRISRPYTWMPQPQPPEQTE